MFQKLFKRKQEKEIKSAIYKAETIENVNNGNNKNDNLDNSYYSYQSYNNHNASCSTPTTSEKEIPLNQNFSSIFNVPKPPKYSFFNQMYESLSSTIKEKTEMPPIEPRDLKSLDISFHFFQDYIRNIKSNYDIFKKLTRARKASENSQENQINCKQSILIKEN